MRRVMILFVFFFLSASQVMMYAQEAQGAASSQDPVAWKYIAASIAVGLACLGGGIAMGQIGAAAMGGMSEDPEFSGKALPYVGLAEGICLWGFLIALIILLVG